MLSLHIHKITALLQFNEILDDFSDVRPGISILLHHALCEFVEGSTHGIRAILAVFRLLQLLAKSEEFCCDLAKAPDVSRLAMGQSSHDFGSEWAPLNEERLGDLV